MNTNGADVWPLGTVTEVGTDPAALFEASETTNPAEGAGLEIVTVPFAVFPPTREFGLIITAVSSGAVTARGADCVEVPSVALMLAVAFVGTASDVTVNVAVFDPAGTVTVPDEGTVAADVLSEAIVTVYPFVGAFPVRVTVAVEFVPPTTLVGLSVMLATVA